MGTAAPFVMFGLQAIGTVAQIGATRQAGRLERSQIENEARLADIEAEQAEADRREALNALLGTQSAQAASFGIVGDSSPSFLNIQREERRRGDEDVNSIRVNRDGQRVRFRIAKDQSKIAERTSIFSSITKLASSAVGLARSSAANAPTDTAAPTKTSRFYGRSYGNLDTDS